MKFLWMLSILRQNDFLLSGVHTSDRGITHSLKSCNDSEPWCLNISMEHLQLPFLSCDNIQKYLNLMPLQKKKKTKKFSETNFPLWYKNNKHQHHLRGDCVRKIFEIPLG